MAVLSIVGLTVAAGYILWLLQRTFYGPVKEAFNGAKDADRMEKVYMVAFVAVILLVGIYPAIITDVIELGVSPIANMIGF